MKIDFWQTNMEEKQEAYCEWCDALIRSNQRCYYTTDVDDDDDEYFYFCDDDCVHGYVGEKYELI